MRRIIQTALPVLLGASAALAGETLFITPDIPSDPGLGNVLQRFEVRSYSDAGYGASPELSVPGSPPISAVHRMDAPGSWLLSLKEASDLDGLLDAVRTDVIRTGGDASGYEKFFCGDALSPPIPARADIDALYLRGGDDGDLILSFDVPLFMAGIEVGRSDLARFVRTSKDCSGWAFAGLEMDAETLGDGIPATSNLIGAASKAGRTLMVFDVPTVLTPSSGQSLYLPGEVVSWDGSSFTLFDLFDNWPLSSRVEGFSCDGNPGSVSGLRLDQTADGEIVLSWDPSCSSGAADYAIYEGVLGDFVSHAGIDCSDDDGDRVEVIPASKGDRYYLVVAHNGSAEGSHGQARHADDNTVTERPRPEGPDDAFCAPVQTVSACPSGIGDGGSGE